MKRGFFLVFENDFKHIKLCLTLNHFKIIELFLFTIIYLFVKYSQKC